MCSRDDNLYAINSDGSEKWRVEISEVDTAPTIGSDGTIYVEGGFTLHAFNPNGSEKWSIDTRSSVISAPVISSDGYLYVGVGFDLVAINGECSGLADAPWPTFQNDVNRKGRYSEEGCSYNISPTSKDFDSNGGTLDVFIDVSYSDCNWWAASNSLDWVSVSPTSGTGDGSVTVSVEENTESSSRRGTVTIANNNLNIDQQASDDSDGGGGGCTMSANASFGLSWILLFTTPVFMIVRRRL